MRARFLDAALPGGRARRPVLLLSLGTFALGTDAFVVSGVLPQVGHDLSVGMGSAGLLVTVFSAAYAVSAPVLAVATGTLCRRRILLIALAVFVLANLLAALAPGYGIMIVARVLAALAAALYTPAATASAAAIAAPEERGRALTAVLGGLTLANALGVPLGTLIAHGFAWRTTFVFVALLGALALFGLSRSLGPLPAGGTASLRERVSAFRIRTVPTTLTATALAVCGVFAIYTYLAWFADRTAGIDGGAVTVVYLTFGVAAVISNLLAGTLIDRVPPLRVAAVAMAGLTVAFGGLALTGLFGRHNTATAVAVCLIVAGWSLVGWMFNPAQQQRLLTAAGAQGQVVLSLNASALYAGQAAGGALGGLLLAHGTTALPLGGVACVLAAMVFLALSARRPLAAAASARPANSPAPARQSAS
ncbi:MFS transporter [Streptomyces sp. NBC_01136]|uniref:MFS transporter n=1 Tax=unclassified Streptomyces TaxID=2593676 RepID=UPI0032492BC9|nr:MFS transporter [Streptomyces sp. NBC_01136]